jgi:tRNA(Ile)-lysidine synthase TilS/MesJ
VLALGQHLDDIAESFIMGAFMNGELRAMKACYNAGAREAREADQANQGSGSSADRSVDHDDDIIFDPKPSAKGESESASPIRVIRPLIYTREAEMRAYAAKAGLPVITENCPACFEAPKERRRVKKMCVTLRGSFSFFGCVIL